MARSRRSAWQRAHDATLGYHFLVALLFTGCLPLTLARSLSLDPDASRPIAAALNTARAAAAHAFSLPG